ncbi:Lrp/AsnC family transcriptional regulator [Stappia sp. GBMRC 2046]|uniref:siroheme decarboxylase n=1 Tax=Stappia sediminis TaxID=2692190 RepID=A0A7X3LRT8_9HYPH|nr:Lrp/AsnC family transcriptional regulator [Stappia sediminis]MXN63942.1 Lrp/AsnC family transcriptional regulator [Stappia sediminis]
MPLANRTGTSFQADTHSGGAISLSREDWRVLDRLQDGIPVECRPFATVADELGLSETGLLTRLRHWSESGLLTRFGPLFDAERLGGAVCLCAMSVPEPRFEDVAKLVNSHREVAHNYAREHALNMWFVVSSDDSLRIEAATQAIEAECGLEVLRFPKLNEFYIGLKVTPPEETGLVSRPLPAPAHHEDVSLSAEERRLVEAMQAGLALVSRPFVRIAEDLGKSEDAVIERTRDMLSRGAIRRIAAVPNHYALGWSENAMTVWDIADDVLEDVGGRIGALAFVSHCYERPRHLPGWPYNLFAMVHGRSKAEVEEKIATLKETCGQHIRAADRLVSTRILKKTGLRLQPSDPIAPSQGGKACSA